MAIKNLIEDLSATGVLQIEMQLLLHLDGFVQLDDIGVPE